MVNKSDLYTTSMNQSLTQDTGSFGATSLRWEVCAIRDIRNLSQKRTYQIIATQRVTIPNHSSFAIQPLPTPQAFEQYPAILRNSITFNGDPNSIVRFPEYSPRTVNTAVMTSLNQSQGDSRSFSQQHTTGSATSQTNSFGMSASLGLFGDIPTISEGVNESYSTTSSQSTSDSTGSDAGRTSQTGSGDSMSIKDWGGYASLDKANPCPSWVSWVWGQEYPWDVIRYRSMTSGTNVNLPQFVLDRLFDFGTDGQALQAFPPSHLSLFGLDFTMKAVWQIDLPTDPTAQEQVTFDHVVTYLTASHLISMIRDQPVPSVQFGVATFTCTVTSPPLDVTVLGLDPVPHAGSNNGAVVGFVSNKFVTSPASGSTFKILSSANNLQAAGSGFSFGTSPGVITADVTHGHATLDICFKILDEEEPYTLFLKHWKASDVACELTVTINGDASNPLTYFVESGEGEGGENNLLKMNLRNKNFASVNYHDYLVLGLNKIHIQIDSASAGQPSGQPSACVYAIRALAIGG